MTRPAEAGLASSAWLSGANGPKDMEYFTHYNLGMLYAQQGMREVAVGEFALAATVDPNAWGNLYNLGVQEGALGCHATATGALTRAVQLKPDEPTIRYELAAALFRSGEVARAEVEFAEVARTQPSLVPQIERFRAQVAAPAVTATDVVTKKSSSRKR